MCTMIAEKLPVAGSGKGPTGWFTLDQAYIAYDHPFHARFEHAIGLDFVNEADGSRVAVELDRASARQLAERLLATVERADAHRADRAVAGVCSASMPDDAVTEHKAAQGLKRPGGGTG